MRRRRWCNSSYLAALAPEDTLSPLLVAFKLVLYPGQLLLTVLSW